MKRLKKHAIGFNSVSSVGGVISAKGVKSKPNDLQIFGYTHEVGEGEKSPDNPYNLTPLDSGNMNLYSEVKLTKIQISSEGTLRRGIEIDACKFKSEYLSIYFSKFNYVDDNCLVNYKMVLKDGTYGAYFHVAKRETIKIENNVDKILFYSIVDVNANYFSLYENFAILDSPILPTEPVTDEHSIVLSNNDKTIQVPTPIALNCVEGVSDYIYKDSDGVWKLKQSTKKIDSYAGETILTPFVSSTGALNSNATIIYQLETPIIHVLSGYAQNLLNSFELQNRNEISVEGYPDIRISGYIQK